MTIRSSKVGRVIHCPGSLTLEERVAVPPESPESSEGTWLHAIAHDRIRREFGASGPDIPMPHAPRTASLIKWCADYYVDTVSALIPRDWSWEYEVELAWDFERFTLTGHPDDVAISPDLTEAIAPDFKGGRIPVEPAEYNWQTSCYIALLKINYPSLQRITGLMIQPFNDEDSGFERISSTVIEGDALERLPAYMEEQINSALRQPYVLNTGVHACRWCPVSHSLQCPAQIAEREAMKITITPDSVERLTLTPNDTIIADWALSASILNKPLKQAADLAKDRIGEVGYIDASDGTRLTMKVQRGDISVPDMPAYMNRLQAVLPEEERRAKCLTPSKGAVIEQIAEARGVPKTSRVGVSAESIYKTELEPLTVQGERRLLVVQQA